MDQRNADNDAEQEDDGDDEDNESCPTPTPVSTIAPPAILITSVGQQPIAGLPAKPTGAIGYPVTLSNGVAAAVFNAGQNSGMGATVLTLSGDFVNIPISASNPPVLVLTLSVGP